jgi:hypothetical protein
MIDAKNINSQPSADGQLPIDFYLNQSSVKKALASLDLKYNFVVVELAEALLREDLTVDEAADFLQENFNFTSEQAENLVDDLLLYIIQPFYLSTTDQAGEIYSSEVNGGVVSEEKQLWQDFLQPERLQAARVELIQATGGNQQLIINYLWDSLGLGKAEEVVVILNHLAIRGELADLWISDARFRGILRRYLDTKYSALEVNSLDWSKPSSGLLSLALQLVMRVKLGLSESDSALVAVSLIDNFSLRQKPQYISLAYFDSRDNSFYWSNVSRQNNSLVVSL